MKINIKNIYYLIRYKLCGVIKQVDWQTAYSAYDPSWKNDYIEEASSPVKAKFNWVNKVSSFILLKRYKLFGILKYSKKTEHCDQNTNMLNEFKYRNDLLDISDRMSWTHPMSLINPMSINNQNNSF